MKETFVTPYYKKEIFNKNNLYNLKTLTKARSKEIGRSNLFKASHATSNWKFKGYEDHDLEHI